MKISQRIARMQAKLDQREKPILIERRSFRPCQLCGAGDEVGERIIGRPCPGCGVVVERERALWPATSAPAPVGETITPASTADALRGSCATCNAVVAP